jgi:hypothetical protein
MMEYVAEFYSRRQQDNFRSKYLMLRSSYPDGDKYSIFLEGSDDKKFYKPYFNNFLAKNIDYIDLNGKDNLTGLYKYLKINDFFDNYGLKHFLFFLDKDYDCFLIKNTDVTANENVFTTEFYSIENYLTQDSVFKEVLSHYFDIEVPEIIEKLAQEYNDFRTVFINHFKSLTILILAHKHKEMEFQKLINDKKLQDNNYVEEVYPQFSLDSLNIEQFFRFTYNTNKIEYLQEHISFTPSISIPAYYFKYFEDNNADLTLLDALSLKTFESMLNSCREERLYLRGKFDIWFLLKFLGYIKSKNKKKAIKELIVEYYESNSIDYEGKKLNINSDHNFTSETIFTLLSILVKDEKIQNFINQNLN